MADIGHDMTDEMLEELEKKIRKEYETANKEVQQKVDDYFARFQVKDANKRAQVQAGTLSQEEYTQWRYGQMCVGERWKDLKDQLAQDYVNVNEIARSTAYGYMPEAYALNHNFATYQVQHDANMDISYTLYNREAVEYLMRDDPQLLPVMSEKTKKQVTADMLWNRQHINSAITQGILQGESIPKISKRLQKVTDMNKSAAIRNARTMMTSVENKGRQDAYDRLKGKGVELQEMWMATLDSRTRHSHRNLHGTYKDPKTGEYANGLRYPADPMGDPEEVYNCRCCEIAEVEGVKVGAPEYSPKMGQMSFEEWKKGGSGHPEWMYPPTPANDNVFSNFLGKTLTETYKELPKEVALPLSKLVSKAAKEEGVNGKTYWEGLLSGKYSNSEIESALVAGVKKEIPVYEWIDRCRKNPTVEKMLELEKAFFDKMTGEEKAALKAYTGSAYDAINGLLRDRGAGIPRHNEKVEKWIEDCHNGLEKCVLEKDLYLRRGTDVGDLAGLFMKGDFYDNYDLLETKTAEELNKMFQGQVGTYFGFTSTSSQWDRGFEGYVEIIFHAPAGTKAASIMGISKFGTGEGETLLQDNTRVVCEQIEESKDGHSGSRIRVFLTILTK